MKIIIIRRPCAVNVKIYLNLLPSKLTTFLHNLGLEYWHLSTKKALPKSFYQYLF